MPAAYLELAEERAFSQHPLYRQPEDFGYDFQGWVSPFTKGAHAMGGGLEQLLQRVFGLTLKDVYATNIFPFIKPGGMSAAIPKKDVIATAGRFTKREIEIVNPKIVLALGNMAHAGLRSVDAPCVALPHPAARIGSIDSHEKRW